MAVDHNNPQSRTEEILIATIDGEEYNKLPQSRLEELLLELKEVIEEGGGGEGGLIQKIFLNGVEQEVVNKAVYLTVITNSVNDLVNYYLKTDTYSKLEVNNLIAAISTLHLQKVETLPTEDISQTTIYLVPKTTLLTNNVYDEYINTDGTSAGWELIGDTQIDLSDYVTFTDLEALLDDYVLAADLETALNYKVDKVPGKGLSSNDFTDEYKTAIGANTTAINGIKNGEEINSFEAVESALSDVDDDVSTLKSGLTTLDNEVNGDATTYPYADVITIEDAIPANLADCNVKIEPVQDLHGQSAPYVGGAGKNKCPLSLDGIIAANSGTGWTWNGNVGTRNNVEVTIQTDNDGNVTGIALKNTSSDEVYIYLVTSGVSALLPYLSNNTEYTLNGCPANGSGTSYRLQARVNGEYYADNGSGANFTYVSGGSDFVRIHIASGVDTTGIVFYPMIRLSTETDTTFAPYTNICPISGHTEAVITDTKPNMYVEGTAQIKVASNWTTDNTVSASVATDLTVSGNAVNGTSSGYRWIHVPMHFEKGRTYHIRPTATSRISNGIGSRVVGITDTYTPSETFDGFVDYGLNAGTYTGLQIGISILDNYDVSDYNKKSPYYTIALGDTIYGGTVDFDSGVMTVTHAVVEYDGSIDENWIYETFQQQYHDFRINIADSKSTTSKSELFLNEVQVGYGNGNAWISNTKNLNVCIGNAIGVDTVESFMEWLSNNPLQVVYPLATPTTIQLTPTQIQLLKGTNTLTASTGDISVTVNGVSGAIGAVQTQANATDAALEELAADIAEKLPTAPTTDGAYVLTVTVASGTPTYSWESAT